MKKLHVLSLAAVLLMGLSACGGDDTSTAPASEPASTPTSEPASEVNPYADLKVGLICLHGSYSTYDKNFIDAMTEVKDELGFTLFISEDIDEGQECYDEAAALVDEGCDVIFADSFGHEPFMIQAAENFPDVVFCHATGTSAASENLDNFGDAFANIYEGRYLAGVVAGLRMQKDIQDGKYSADEAKIGYVGAFTYAEIISGFTSFYLGARSVVPTATMEVKYTGSWYDQDAENSIALELIDRGCKLISQHADSHGAPQACQSRGIPNVSYNGSTLEDGPTTFLVSSRINWAPYYKYVLGQIVAGEKIANDWSGGFAEGSVELSEFSDNCAPGTAEYVANVKAQLENGTLHVFDTSKFTVGAEEPSEANMKPGPATWADTGTLEFIAGGYYHESEYRSAPSFDVIIDGITNLNTVF